MPRITPHPLTTRPGSAPHLPILTTRSFPPSPDEPCRDYLFPATPKADKPCHRQPTRPESDNPNPPVPTGSDYPIQAVALPTLN